LDASPIHKKFEIDAIVQRDLVSFLVDWSGYDFESARYV
jgi:hypothetical protein